MQNVIFSPLPLDQLKLDISDTIKKELGPLLLSLNQQTPQTEFISRKEAAKFLGVTLPTIQQWTKTGKITGYRIASRVRYKKAEIESSLSQIKTRR